MAVWELEGSAWRAPVLLGPPRLKDVIKVLMPIRHALMLLKISEEVFAGKVCWSGCSRNVECSTWRALSISLDMG